MKLGDKRSVKRTFSDEDIRLFARFSGDEGEHHLVPDDQGRLMAHGLLTATMPTRIGGEMNFIAQQMMFEFHRPVFAGDEIECVVTIIELERQEKQTRLGAQCICRNQDGKVVMSGLARGVVRNSD